MQCEQARIEVVGTGHQKEIVAGGILQTIVYFFLTQQFAMKTKNLIYAISLVSAVNVSLRIRPLVIWAIGIA